jgi:hypothetical protein
MVERKAISGHRAFAAKVSGGGGIRRGLFPWINMSKLRSGIAKWAQSRFLEAINAAEEPNQ